jgi:hypothetical protein
MKPKKTILQLLIWICLTMAILYTAYFILEYKNDLEISDRHQKLQTIEESTDIIHLKQTARMYVNFLYGVHNAAISLWLISVIYGTLNIIILICCATLLNKQNKLEGGKN